MKSKKFTLQNYSGFTGVFLLMTNAVDAQAVYTDIEPDIEIEFDGQTVGIDMDNNGSFDFEFLKTSVSYENATTSSTYLVFRRTIWAGPEIISNEIAGTYFTHGAGFGTSYRPYALEFGSLVNESLSFQNWGFQTMARAHILLSTTDDWNFDAGQWIYGETPNYLGVKFWDDDECLHYGWIRCSVIDTANILKIYDYAYESKCETGIIAGDTIGDTTTEIIGIDETNILAAEIYTFNKTIYIKINEPKIDAALNIFNIDGAKIYQNSLTESFSSIQLEIPSGIYIVKVIGGDNKIFTKKIIIG